MELCALIKYQYSKSIGDNCLQIFINLKNIYCAIFKYKWVLLIIIKCILF